MLKVEEAVKIILENTKVLKSEKVGILESLNRVLAEDVYSDSESPVFDNSAMDGYAVIASDTAEASKENPCVLDVIESLPAGYIAKESLRRGQAIRIMTGAPMPSGANAVVMFENTEAEISKVKLFKNAREGDNVRHKGEDFMKGDLVIPKGKIIRPSEIGLFAALNISSVIVTKNPIVSILATGDEIVDLGGDLGPGRIRNVNSYSLYSQVLKYGGRPVNLGIAKDIKEEIQEKLQRAMPTDILLISGGVSTGDYDYVKDILIEMGMEIKFWKVSMKPGKPVVFGNIKETLVFGLPGNPISSMITFEQFVKPALFKMQGRKNLNNQIIKAIAEEDIIKKDGKKHFIRAFIRLTDGKYFVKPVGLQSSAALRSMVISNCLIILSEDINKINMGDEVPVQILDGLED